MPEFTALTDLVTVNEVLGGTSTSADNTLLDQLISAVSAAASTYCNRNFGVQSYTENYNGEGMPSLWLNQRPIQSVSSVTVNGNAVLQRPSAQPWNFGWANDNNQIVITGGLFPYGFQNVTVVYSAGLSISSTNFPDIWRAAAEWVATLYKGQQHIDVRSQSGIEGQSTSFIQSMPWSAKMVFDKYRQIAPVQTLGI